MPRCQEMARAVAEAVSIPVIASGEAGKLKHPYEAVIMGNAAAVLVASILQAKPYLKERDIPVKI